MGHDRRDATARPTPGPRARRRTRGHRAHLRDAAHPPPGAIRRASAAGPVGHGARRRPRAAALRLRPRRNWKGCPHIRDMWVRGVAWDLWLLAGGLAIGVVAGVLSGLWCAGHPRTL